MRVLYIFYSVCIVSVRQSAASDNMGPSPEKSAKLRKLEKINETVPKAQNYTGYFLMHYTGPGGKAISLGRKYGFSFKKKILDEYYLFSDTRGTTARAANEVSDVAMNMMKQDKMMLEFKMEEAIGIQKLSMTTVERSTNSFTLTDSVEIVERSADGVTLVDSVARVERSADGVTLTDSVARVERSADGVTLTDSVARVERFSDGVTLTDSVARVERSADGITLTDSVARVERSADGFNVSDSFWSKQWHLHPEQSPSMRVFEAWEMGYNGNGVVVGIVGDGIDTTHYDLVDNFNASLSYDFVDDDAGAEYINTYEDHSTRVGGVIAASKNNQCIIGIAYEASIAGLRAHTPTTGVANSWLALAWTYKLDEIDILYNGFGIGVDHGSGFFEMEGVAESALMQGIREGRHGKGTIFIFGAGNDGEYYDDCNTVELFNSMFTIAVSALAPDGGPATYAEECTNIMAAAYAGEEYENGTKLYLATTYINDTCIENYGGAAAASSVASGILALTLQANSNLTWRDVQHLLAETSTSVGVPRGNFYVNAAGKNVSNGLGFGLMNAERLVQTAATWNTVPERISCSSGTLQVNKCCTSSIEASYTVDDCHIQYLEHVQISVSCEAYWREHTELHIVSPQGTDSRILRQRKQDYATGIFDWTFMSVHTWGENPTGNWTIRMDDFLNCDNEIHLYSWALTLYGTVTDPLDGTPANGTLGGYCDDATPCTDGTKCLQSSNICVDCTVPGHRAVDNFCMKDGYGYCDVNVTCKEENAWCNTDNVCETCDTGYHEIDGACKQDGTLGGYCDALAVCVDSGVACDSNTDRCVNCTNGYHIVGDSCIEDGILGGYCDREFPCLTTSCDPSTNSCIFCSHLDNHRVLDGFCIEDGTIGGFCSSEVSCAVYGSGCDPDSNTCINCTMNGYRTVSGFCRQDGVISGYCNSSVTCSDGTGCDFESNVCINCSSTGYRVLSDGYCRQDGAIEGYCDTEIPCVTFAAGCVPGYNVCDICYAGHTLINGYCVADDVPESETSERSSNAGVIAGTVIAGFIIGTVVNGIIFLIAVQKALIAKTGYAPNNMRDRFLYVFKFKDYFTK